MKAKNLPTRVHARRIVALDNLEQRPSTPENVVEIAILRARTREAPINFETKKHLATASEARRFRHRGRLTR